MHRIRVMLTTEGTYPFHQGGVSTWCQVLLERLPQVDFVIYSIMMDPYVTQKFTLPGNTTLIKVPLWGTEEPSEHLTTPFAEVYAAKFNTGPKAINEHFLPLFQQLIEEIISINKSPATFGNTLFELYRYFKVYDYQISFKSSLIWDVFKQYILAKVADRDFYLPSPTVFDLIQSLGWLYRFLVVLNTPLPPIDVAHSAAAAFCGIPCILAKLEQRTPYLLTEHGVYMREQYLSMARRGYSSYLTTFLIRLLHSITSLNYAMADQVSPVCLYNTRWEKELGVAPAAINVIYNGVDPKLFIPRQDWKPNVHPTVVTVARVDPVKDMLTLIQAAARVKETIPDVRFVVYGSVSDTNYYEECLALRQRLKLETNFIFAGHTNEIAAAYQSGDVIALSSITEAFPYSVVEAMMVGKAVVATDVGGVKEALGDCGIAVSPRSVEELAQALTALLTNPELREALGKEARERALNYFTVDKAVQHYFDSYARLTTRQWQPRIAAKGLLKQQSLAEKGYALAGLGLWQEAINQFRLAIAAAIDSPAVPAILVEMARGYNHLGKYFEALTELQKAELLINYQELAESA